MAPTPLVPLSAAIVAAALLISAAPASASNWQSGYSAPTVEVTIANTGTECKQP